MGELDTTPVTRPQVARVTLAAFLAAVVIGGSNFVAVRFSNRELDPLWGAGSRFVLAALIFAAACAALRLRLPPPRTVVRIAGFGLLAFAASYGLLYWAMQEVPAGVAASVMAAGPLLTLLFATVHRLETLHVRALVGAAVALLGSVLMFFQPGDTDFGGLQMAAVCLAAVTAAESVVLAKRIGPVHPVLMNLWGMAAGGVALLVASLALREQWALPREPATVAAFVYLVAASVVLFLLVLHVIQRWTASASSYVFVLMPPVAVVLGAVLGGEAITTATVLGGLVILTGVYTGALRRTSAAR